MEYIKRMVNTLVAEHGTSDPFEICSNMDVFVFYPDLPENVQGFYYNVKGYKIIGINSSLDDESRRIICAHELGHSLLHPDMNVFFATQKTNFLTEKFEREADYFCACLLIDGSVIKRLRAENEQVTASEISSLCRMPRKIVDIWLEGKS
ncbi:MAG: ImmA/IrrE family metallo-endopeptidase [Clostridia bacterium]|nr:ImmA/IrrE family metallo-endopeptidase [Clostridia bacterium]